MVESYICCGVQPTMVTSVACPRISRHGAVALVNVLTGGPAIGGSNPAKELHLGRRIVSHGVVSCSNSAHGAVLPKVQITAGCPVVGFGSSLVTVIRPSLSLRRVKAGNKLENDREEAVSSRKEEDKEKSVDRKEGLVERIEAELGRQFGGVLWFSVLLLSLAFFGGVYVYFIVNYVDFNDIPILRGPQR